MRKLRSNVTTLENIVLFNCCVTELELHFSFLRLIAFRIGTYHWNSSTPNSMLQMNNYIIYLIFFGIFLSILSYLDY